MQDNLPIYGKIVRRCEEFLEEHGDNFRGVGWTKGQHEADARYQTMLELIRPQASDTSVTLLDFGCGAAHLYEYILQHGLEKRIAYTGLDVSAPFLSLSRGKFPDVMFLEHDILQSPEPLPIFDYVVCNGIFTMKCDLSFESMMQYCEAAISKLFAAARIGLAFNVMSKQVEWERDDLFHVPFDTMATFLTNHLSRNFVFRHDYRLYEYTTYVYH